MMIESSTSCLFDPPELPAHAAGAGGLFVESRFSSCLAEAGASGIEASDRDQHAEDDRLRARRAARDGDVDREDSIDAAGAGISFADDTPGPGTICAISGSAPSGAVDRDFRRSCFVSIRRASFSRRRSATAFALTFGGAWSPMSGHRMSPLFSSATGLIYIEPDRDDFTTQLNLVDEPLATLPLERVRPPRAALDEIMDVFR